MQQAWRRIRPHLPLPLFLALLASVRWQLAANATEGSTLAAWLQGMELGLFNDVSALLASQAGAQLFSAVFGISGVGVFIAATILFWGTSIANAFYMGFFGTALPLWVARDQIGDTGSVTDTIGDLLFKPAPFLSLVLLGLLIWIAVRFRDRMQPPRRLRSAGLAAGLTIAALFVHQAPVWFGLLHFDPVGKRFMGDEVGELAIFSWIDEASRGEESELGAPLEDPGRVVARLRDLDDPLKLPPEALLMRDQAVPRAQTLALRRELGLPAEGPLNVVVVLVESLRAYEFFHPQFGDEVFPRLHALAKKQGILFRHAHSSSLQAAQTVNGLFSTLCSTLPNGGGPAPYIGFSRMRVTCLPELFAHEGYRTLSFQAFTQQFQNQDVFEALNGVQEAYDSTRFIAEGYAKQKLAHWGVPDGDYLPLVLSALQAKAAEGKPLFAHVSTTGSHFPHKPRGTAVLGPVALAATEGNKAHRAMLATYREADEAVGTFVEALFNSPLGKNTVVAVLADHGIGQVWPSDPALRASWGRRLEVRSRIPMLLLTRALPKPQEVRKPVHQVDLAPALVAIAGLSSAPAPWTGTGLLSERPGRPFAHTERGKLAYHVGSVDCRGPRNRLRCTDASSMDLLYGEPGPEVPENTSLSELIDKILRANRQAIERNLLIPTPR